LEKAASSPEARAMVGQFTDPESALQSIARDGADLVVTHWGHGLAPNGDSTAEHVLSEVRSRDLRAPVVVFASGSHADDNKRASMALGATGYEFEWEGLFREIERIFTTGSRSNIRR
jgi:DNA-binding NarL/FixJ family response regulator